MQSTEVHPVQVTWMNHIMRTMWPHYNQAIGKMVLDTVKPQVDDLCKQVCTFLLLSASAIVLAGTPSPDITSPSYV